MSKFLSLALLLVAGMGLFAAPAMAQANEADNVGAVHGGGGEGAADTTLGKKGLVWSTDGFSVRMTTRVQFRLTYQNEVGHGAHGQNGRDFINFRVRRAKTSFSGHIFQKEFQYKLVLNWMDGGDAIVEEGYFRWTVMQYINIQAGQYKPAWNWEELTSSGAQQFVDRSYVNEVFNQDKAKGIQIDGKIGEDVSWLKYSLGLFNGVLKSNHDFRNADVKRISDTFSDGIVDGDMMLNLRLETHPLGDIKHSLNDGRGEDEFDQVLFAIGLAVNYLIAGFDNEAIRPDNSGLGATGSGRSRTSSDTWAFTIDGHFRWHGLSLDVAFFWRHTEFHNRGANRYSPTSPTHNGIANNTDMGFTVDVSYFIIAKTLNVGLRYNRLEADEHWQNGGTSRNAALRPDATEIGISVNYYLHGDNLKLTLDILYVSEQLAFGLDAAGTGAQSLSGVYTSPPQRSVNSVAGENADYADTWIIRLQLQWIF